MAKNNRQDQQSSKLTVEIRYANNVDGQNVPDAIMLADGEIYKISKIHSVRYPSPFMDDTNTRYKVSIAVDGHVNSLQLYADGSAGYVEAV